MIRLSSMGLAIIFTLYLSGTTTSALEWHYEHQEKWPELCQKGRHQSPVALDSDAAEEHMFIPLKFKDYDADYSATITNNGHTVVVQLDNVTSKPSIADGGLGSTYLLDSFHFHWDSEHTISGRRFPLELHLVHYDQKYNDLTTALQRSGGVAVFAVLFYLSPDNDTELAHVYNAVDNLIQKKAKINDPQSIPEGIELDDVLPRDRAGFYRYNGSLTTPLCTEGIVWTVFTHGLPISEKQLRIFSGLRTHENKMLTENYRALQELYDRKIELKVSNMDTSGSNIFRTSTASMVLIFFMSLIGLNL